MHFKTIFEVCSITKMEVKMHSVCYSRIWLYYICRKRSKILNNFKFLKKDDIVQDYFGLRFLKICGIIKLKNCKYDSNWKEYLSYLLVKHS